MNIPTRWQARFEAQLEDAERRLAAADAHLAAERGGRALEEAYPGVMAAALVRVWLTDEPWHTRRGPDELQALVRAALPSGFAVLAELQHDPRSLAGWRADDARALIDEGRLFVATVREEYTRCVSPPTG